MAYNQNIPSANDLLSQSQADIQENFSQIKTVFDINHITFGDANQGKHLYLQLPEHAAPTTGANEAGFYANVGATSTVTELFFRRESGGENIPMTERATGATPGWTYLPSGIMLQWGSATLSSGSGSAGTLVNFPRSFPTACLSVQVTSAAAAGSIAVFINVRSDTITTAKFNAYMRGSNDSGYVGGLVYWFAVGV